MSSGLISERKAMSGAPAVEQQQKKAPPASQTSPTSPATSPYLEAFQGQRKFFAAIKRHKRYNLYPIQNVILSGVSFQRATQQPMAEQYDEGELSDHDGEEGQEDDQDSLERSQTWLTLGPRQPGIFIQIPFQCIRNLCGELTRTAIRWTNFRKGRPRACRWVDLNHSVMGHPVNQLLQGDEPLSRYLVLLPLKELARLGGREKIDRLPSMLDLDPNLTIPQIPGGASDDEEVA
jgi:hypothetical protein